MSVWEKKTWSERFADAFGHWPDGDKTIREHPHWKEMLSFLDKEAAARAEEVLIPQPQHEIILTLTQEEAETLLLITGKLQEALH